MKAELPRYTVRLKILFLLGAGASVPAGINAIVDLVGDLKNWLKQQGKKDHLELTDKIIEIISTSPKIKNDKGDYWI